MIDTVGSDLRSAFRLGENESTLENGLGVERKRLGGPIGAHAPIPHRRFDISFQRRGMAADAAVACLANGRCGLMPVSSTIFCCEVMKRGIEKIKQDVSTLGKDENGWRVALNGFGGRQAYAGDWTLRAAAAMAGIYGNNPAEAVYPLLATGSDGNRLVI